MASLYGYDISTFVDGDLDPAWVVQTDPRVVLGEAVARRLTTPPDTLPDDPEYGFDVRQLLEADLDETDLAQARAQIALQAEADERVQVAAEVTVTLLNERLTVRVRLLSAASPFTLVLTADRLTTSVNLLLAA
jgi:phage baseplate assembly protein W